MTMPKSIVSKIEDALRRRCGVRPGHGILVAISGGPDSTFLCHALREIAHRWPLRLAAAHFHHGIRGPAADRDAAFAATLARDLGLPFFSGRADAPAHARRHGLSLEEAARELRLGFLREAAAGAGADRIALGHTADDQAEEVLLRLLRGSALAGLSGIPWRRGPFVRPLLGTRKAEILAELERRRLPWCRDETNSDPRHLRNRVRSRLLPLLREHFNPAVEATLNRTAALLADDEAVLEDLARAAFSRLENDAPAPSGGPIRLRVADLLAEAPAIRRRVVRLALEAAGAPLRRLVAAHLLGVEALLARNRDGRIDLPGGVRAERRDDRLVLHRGEVPAAS
ncbi:tRNA lysidine(34) synthetase TilS, partial [Dissulfurirhabdus thermomarina]